MKQIQIIGIGWYEDDLTLGAVRALRAAEKIVLKTGRCGCSEWLKSEGILFDTLDALYEQCEDFDELTEEAAKAVISAAQESRVAYCVNDLSDKTCALICEAAQEKVELIAGVSEGNALLPFAGDDVRIVSAADADRFEADARVATLVRELDNPMLASDIKLKLSERYPEEMDILICDAGGKITKIPLCDLDRMETYDHRVCALIPAVRELDRLERFDVKHLEEIMRRLRDFDGCPWDREQTHESLKRYLVEEAYEAVDAIDRDDPDDLYDELGDVLLQVVFHADIARQYGEFELSDVTTAICRKMIRRHPHVFSTAQADNPDEVSLLWDEIKKKEKAQRTGTDALKDVAGSMPALMRAAKVCKRACKQGAEAPDASKAWTDWTKNSDGKALGRLLFALAGEANRMGLEAELSLNGETDRFIQKFAAAEGEEG